MVLCVFFLGLKCWRVLVLGLLCCGWDGMESYDDGDRSGVGVGGIVGE